MPRLIEAISNPVFVVFPTHALFNCLIGHFMVRGPKKGFDGVLSDFRNPSQEHSAHDDTKKENNVPIAIQRGWTISAQNSD